MADKLPSIEEVGGANWAHDWLPYQTYVAVHDASMERLYNEGLVIEGAFTFAERKRGNMLEEVHITGRIECKYQILVEVDKRLEADGKRVRGFDYAYHAWVKGIEQSIIRYDSAYGLDDLHRHEFNPTTGKEEARVQITLEELPTLDGFIRQAVALGERIANAKA